MNTSPRRKNKIVYYASVHSKQGRGRDFKRLVRTLIYSLHYRSLAAGALSYAELGTVVKKSGGEFSFYQSAFADMHKFWGPLPSFIYSWVSIMYVRPAEVAIIILTFAEYFIRPFSLWASMSPDTEHTVKKTVSVLALGEYYFYAMFTRRRARALSFRRV